MTSNLEADFVIIGSGSAGSAIINLPRTYLVIVSRSSAAPTPDR
jgi:hypothetical protein